MITLERYQLYGKNVWGDLEGCLQAVCAAIKENFHIFVFRHIIQFLKIIKMKLLEKIYKNMPNLDFYGIFYKSILCFCPCVLLCYNSKFYYKHFLISLSVIQIQFSLSFVSLSHSVVWVTTSSKIEKK